VAVDASAALAMPGVLAVVTGPDLPERRFGRRVRDLPTLARDEARFCGERVAAVVAESRQQAERAAARVVVEYEPLPAVLDPAAIVVHPVAIGGDFGGKGSPMDAPLCVELARAVGRPVRLVLRHPEDLLAANPRHPSRVRIRLGCDASGRLGGLCSEALLDGGAYAGFKPIPTVVPHGAEEPGRSY